MLVPHGGRVTEKIQHLKFQAYYYQGIETVLVYGQECSNGQPLHYSWESMQAGRLIITHALRLHWFRVKRAEMGNQLPRVGESKSKYNIPASRLYIANKYSIIGSMLIMTQA
jgi:hypothetical protein